jgi:hypothetical protein
MLLLRLRCNALSGFVGVVLLGVAVALGQTPAAKPPKKAPAKPWAEMDYGPVLSATIESSYPQRNITQKGIAVRLDAKMPAYVLFDEDLMRYSLAWTGGPIDWNGVLFNGNHQVWPAAVGDFIYGTNLGPGWAKAGSFDDPRTHYKSTDYKKESKEWQDRAYGPLPHEQAQYRGRYLNGQQVILSYTVGGVGVLDSPGLEMNGDLAVFTRTLNIEKSSADLDLNVLDQPGQMSKIIHVESAQKQQPQLSAKNNWVVLGDLNPPVPAPVDTARPAFPANGLIDSWSFDEADGNAAGSDPQLSAEVSGATRTPGRFGSAISTKAGQHAIVKNTTAADFSKDFSIVGWVKTKQGGTIVSKTIAGKWVPGGKTLFVEGGNLTLDMGWVGAVRSPKTINDGQWHHVGVTYQAQSGAVQLYVDGKADAKGSLKSMADPAGSQMRFGLTSDDFPRADGNRLDGAVDEIAVYSRALTAAEIGKLAPGAPAMPEKAIIVAAMGQANEMTWSIVNHSGLRLHIPAAATPAKIKLAMARVTGKTTPTFKAALEASAPAADLSAMTHGGAARYPQELVTKGVLAKADDKPYVVDQLIAPIDNPFKSRMRFGAFDFFPGGKSAAISTWDGDVWLVTNIDEKLEHLTWRRIATGLYQPLGLKIVSDAKVEEGKPLIYALCRDEIVRLHDLNSDGEMDYYECFNNDAQVTEHFHEFAMGLQTDAEGNFYYAKSARHGLAAVVPQHGTLLKVSKDGSTTTILANGFRAANGVGIGPNGEFAATDQEGYYTPANRINLIIPSLGTTPFYGNLWSYLSTPRTLKDGYDPPLCFLPVNVDRSPAEDVWVTSDKWGPLKGSMIHTSYGTGKLFLVPHEIVDGVPQGGAVPFPDIQFRTGVMRARFSPADGQLYLCGLVGWATDMTAPGGFYRVRYTGKPVNMPVGLHVKKDRIELTFTNPLDKTTAQDLSSYAVQQWNYRWTQNYGSKHYSVTDPNKQGEDDVEISAATLSEDGKTVTLKIPDLKPVMQMKIQLNLKTSDGAPIKQTIHNTINRIPQ